MSTRSCIAKPRKKDGWEGVYHHSDGYPEGVGRTIWNLVKNRYKGDVAKFHKEIIDNNLDGWSALRVFHPDWGDPEALLNWDGESVIGVDDNMKRYKIEGTDPIIPIPISYKNDPERSNNETECPCNETDGDPLFIEWVYVVKPDGLAIYANQSCKEDDPGSVKYDNCVFRHVFVQEIAWNDPEPDWEKIRKKVYAEAS